VSTESEGARPPASTFILVATLDGIILQRLEITTETLSIGRLPENVLVLSDQGVSRRHAEVRLEEGRPMLADVGSGSGTLVGSIRLLPNQPMLLEVGVEVSIGPYILTMERGTAARTATATSASERARPAPDVDFLPSVPRRQTMPAPQPFEARSRYLQHLPSIFHESDFLGRMLLIYEALWEPLEQRQKHIAMYFSPATCPAPMLEWMAGWMNLHLDAHWPEPRRRQLLREAMQLYRWRGTRYGLTRMLEVCTGQPVQITEDPETPFVFRVIMTAHPDVTHDFIERLVRAHKPAHVGYVLEINP
jgi:phage tail-like protein